MSESDEERKSGCSVTGTAGDYSSAVWTLVSLARFIASTHPSRRGSACNCDLCNAVGDLERATAFHNVCNHEWASRHRPPLVPDANRWCVRCGAVGQAWSSRV
jgi:hypothetical protein